MTKYLISRLLIVFMCKFFFNWAFNIDKHLAQFFDLEVGEEFRILLVPIGLSVGLIVVNFVFLVVRLGDNNDFVKLIEILKNSEYADSLKNFFKNFFNILGVNFHYECKREKYPNIFILFILIFMPFINGNPFFNNYYGIYKEHEIEGQGRSGTETYHSESQDYIVHKSNKGEISSRMSGLETDTDEDELSFAVKKRGYLFVQTGLIDGFKTYYKEYQGFIAYLECMAFSLIECFINSIIYFLIPFVGFISIYHYRTR